MRGDLRALGDPDGGRPGHTGLHHRLFESVVPDERLGSLMLLQGKTQVAEKAFRAALDVEWFEQIHDADPDVPIPAAGTLIVAAAEASEVLKKANPAAASIR